jgi:hypothetical protein
MKQPLLRHLGIGICLILLGVPAVHAQTNDHTFRSFDWNEDVGAPRAAGMGGAFVGLADDLTAVQLNPAGIGTLRKTEVSASLLNRGTGTLALGDTTASAAAVGFVGAAGPIAGSRFSIGGYVAQPFAENITLNPINISGIQDTGSLDASVTDYGAAASWSPTNSIHVGARLNVSHLSLSSTLFHPVAGTRDVIDVGMTSSSNALAGSVGLLVKANSDLSLGAMYELGSRWVVDRSAVSRDVGPLPGSTFDFSSPSRLLGGFGYRVTPDILVVGDAGVVFLSRLSDTFAVEILPVTAASYHIDSGFEGRGGVEVTIPRRRYFVQVRGGILTEPPGAFRFEAPTPASESVFFQGAGRETQATLGASFGDKPERLRLDVAAALGGIRSVVLVGVKTRF